MLHRKKWLIRLSTLLLSLGFLSGCAKKDLSMYYNINIDKGIEVYTHILGENKYEFGFMPGTNMWKDAKDVNRLIYVNLDEGKDIIQSYGDKISERNLVVFIIPKSCTNEDIRHMNNDEALELEIKGLLLDN